MYVHAQRSRKWALPDTVKKTPAKRIGITATGLNNVAHMQQDKFLTAALLLSNSRHILR